MNSRKVWNAAAEIAIVFAIMILPVAAGADEALPKGTLSGRVVDEEGQPLAGARVRIQGQPWIEAPEDNVRAQAVSDAEGWFRLGPLEPVYRSAADVVVEAEGFALQYVPGGSYSIYAGADCDLGTIRMDKGCVFTGQVLDHDGTPVADAYVECDVDRHYLGHTIAPVGTIEVIKTDHMGRYRTRPLGIGIRGVLVRVPHRQLAYVIAPDTPRGEHILPPFVLKHDVPIYGTITDAHGKPLAGAEVGADGDADHTKSDEAGEFLLSGFGPNPKIQFKVRKDGYVPIDWNLKVADEGFRWYDIYSPEQKHGPIKELDVVMEPVAWIEGEALDEATGEPIELERVVLCFFERKPDGEVVLNGCRVTRFQQPRPGRFRVPYTTPGEFHLALSAEGYHDAEAFTPKVLSLEPIEGIRVVMRKKAQGPATTPPRPTIAGTVSDHGHPLETGWIGLWVNRQPEDLVNAFVMRGRTVTGDPIIYARAPIRDGKYQLTVPFQGDDFYLVAEAPGRAPTQIGPIAAALGENKSLDVVCVEGGAIRGTVKNRPANWRNDLWVVAFTDNSIRAETRVLRDGTFTLRQLPPGRYGLKVGHDAYVDSEIPRGPNIPKEAWQTLADPWKRAAVVEVTAGAEREVALEVPGE